MKYLIRCRLNNSSSESDQSIYYFTGFDDNGAMVFNIHRADAMIFKKPEVAELHQRILMGQSCIIGCTIEQLTT
jgi:hypothetical protein